MSWAKTPPGWQINTLLFSSRLHLLGSAFKSGYNYWSFVNLKLQTHQVANFCKLPRMMVWPVIFSCAGRPPRRQQYYCTVATTCWGVAKVGTGYASITCIRWPNRTVSVKAYCSEGVAPQGQLYYSTVLSRSSRLHAWGVHFARSIKKQEPPGCSEDAQLPRYTLMFHPAFVIFSLVFW